MGPVAGPRLGAAAGFWNDAAVCGNSSVPGTPCSDGRTSHVGHSYRVDDGRAHYLSSDGTPTGGSAAITFGREQICKHILAALLREGQRASGTRARYRGGAIASHSRSCSLIDNESSSALNGSTIFFCLPICVCSSSFFLRACGEPLLPSFVPPTNQSQ